MTDEGKATIIAYVKDAKERAEFMLTTVKGMNNPEFENSLNEQIKLADELLQELTNDNGT